MRAIVFDHTLSVVDDFPAPRRQAGESLIRVKYAGICNTDLEISRGYMHFRGILGHEFSGVVEESDNTGFQGKRVVGEINVACGRCDFCRSGLGRHCPKRTVLGISGHAGVMAEFCVLPDANLHIIPPNVSDEEAVFCEPLAAAFEILSQISIKPKWNVVVLGDGKLGLLVAQAVKTTGAEIRLVGHSPKKLALAEQLSIRIADQNEIAPHLADVVIDCTGSTTGFSAALDTVKPRGTIVLKTTVADQYEIDLAPVVIHEIMVIGSRCGRFEPALRSLADKTVRVREMITEIFPLADAVEAFARASDRDSLKVLLRL